MPKSKTFEEKLAIAEARLLASNQEQAYLRKQLKAAQFKQSIFETLAEELRTVVVPLDPLPDVRDDNVGGTIEETAVLVLSDEHADEVIEPHKVGGLEKFDFKIALCRAERLVDSVIDWTQNQLSNHSFKKLVILANGDHTSGEIHEATGRSQYRNQFKNSLAVGQMHALMIRDLAPYFKEIDVVGLSGNHGRRSAKKDYDGAKNNWDFLIHEIAATHCKDIKNVKFHIPDCYSICMQIEGHGFYLAHGDDIKSWNGIPWYGLERKTRRLVALYNSTGQKVSYFIFGHFHSVGSIADLKGEMIINGAFPATSPYSFESFSGYREPMQLLMGVHPKYGVTWRLPVKIKDVDAEIKGPQRYSVVLAEDGFDG